MPTFDDFATTPAPPEEVWKLLYDPHRFPEWWSGMGSVEDPRPGDDGADFTMYPEGYPDFPMPQALRTETKERRMVVSCLVSDLRFEWTLEDLGGGEGTRIGVHVEIPEAEAQRLEGQREAIGTALAGLAAIAARSAASG